MPKRVLIVDDFTDTRRLAKVVLERSGYEVIEAADGYEAVKRAVKDHPDVILMDLAMPVMDGIQATQAIRQHFDLTEVPIIAITAYGDFYNERARDVGCNDVVQKPVEISRLQPIVEQFFRQASFTEE
ncbi:MAG TPA: response regulator [Pyrinomonadaceae bacterium]